jgi:hypothetical protein
MKAPFAALCLATCGLTACAHLDELARSQFAKDHGGCAATTLQERPDLLPPGFHAPTVARAGTRAYEVTGCSSHDLKLCDSAGYTSNDVEYPPTCTARRICEPPGCAKDYRTAAAKGFVQDFSCPAERVSATVGAMPSAPPDISSDPARLQLWTQALDDNLKEHRDRGDVAVLVSGCNSESIYYCGDWFPDSPKCARRDAPPGR